MILFVQHQNGCFTSMLPLMGPTNGLGVEKTGTPQMFMQPARPNFQEVVETTRDAFDSSCRKFGFHKQNQPSVCILFPPPKWFLRFLNSRGPFTFPNRVYKASPGISYSGFQGRRSASHLKARCSYHHPVTLARELPMHPPLFLG